MYRLCNDSLSTLSAYVTSSRPGRPGGTFKLAVKEHLDSPDDDAGHQINT